MDLISYTDKDSKISGKYFVEYINDAESWESLNSGSHPAPWELYSKKEFDDIGQAISYYLCREFDNKTYDCKLFEHVLLNGEVIQEKYIELDNTIGHSLRSFLNRDMKLTLEKQNETISDLLKELTMYQSFIQAYRAEKLFNEFKWR